MKNYLLKVSNISKTFKGPKKVKVLDDISLTLEKGKSMAITGPSGIGKTTLLHILATLEKKDSGYIEIDGKNADALPKSEIRNKIIGFIFQAYNLLEDFSVLDNVLMPARIARDLSPKVKTRAFSLVEKMGLMDRIFFPAKILSPGEKQRVAIARAFCNNPDLIFADEPSGNLDEETSKTVHDLLLSCVKEHNKSLLLVTHDKDLASLCDEVFILKEGKLSEVQP